MAAYGYVWCGDVVFCAKRGAVSHGRVMVL